MGENRRFIPVHIRPLSKWVQTCAVFYQQCMFWRDVTPQAVSMELVRKKAVSILQKHKVELDGLNNFRTNCKVLGDDTVRVSFTFIGFWFGEATLNLNHLRYKIFTKKKKRGQQQTSLNRYRAWNHVKRANYQCFIWKHARDQILSLESPTGNEWTKDKMGNLVPLLMAKDRAPQAF